MNWDLRLGDCLDPVTGLASLADKSVDVIITDPVWPNAPAGMFDVANPARTFAGAAEHFPRLGRRVLVWLGFGSDPRFLIGMPTNMPFVRVCWLRYARPSYIGTLLGSGDVVYVFGDNRGPWDATLLPGEVTSTDAKGRDIKDHPCPRKVEHAMWLIKNFTDPGELILDPFSGSGTTGVAAIRLGRRFLGWERDPKYHAVASRRLAGTKEQTDLFRAKAPKAKQGVLL